MNLNKGPQYLLINKETDFPFFFYKKLTSGDENLIETDDVFAVGAGTVTEGAAFSPDADGVVTNITAADIDRMKISGFADFFKGQILKASKTAGIPVQAQSSTLTITIPSAVVADKEVVVDVKLTSLDDKSEYASHYSDFARTRSYQLLTETGDTVTTLAARLALAINANQEGKNPHITASAAAGVLTIVPVDPLMSFTISVRFASEAGLAFAFATPTPAYEGRGTYYNLSREFLQTEANIWPYNKHGQKMLPIEGDLYACYTIIQSVTREDLSLEGGVNMAPTGKFSFVIYVNQTSAAATITKLNTFFNAQATVKENYAATTAADAIVAETATTTLA